MTSGLLDFFILEASEHVEQLDGLVARAAGAAPDAESFGRHARALRGSATMAKVAGIAGIAGGLERVARALREGQLVWSPSVYGAVIAAIDDLKILLHGVRNWGPSEDQRAARRAAELGTVAPAAAAAMTAGGSAPNSATSSHAFLVSQTGDVAAGLGRIAMRGIADADGAQAVHLLRALRGVAALNDLPPIAEVVAAADDVVKSLELGSGIITDAQRVLLTAAAVVLGEAADALRAGRRPETLSRAVTAFAAAAETLHAGARDTDRIVPIASLFPNDGGQHVVHLAPHPPTTPAQRFRLEVVSQAEHLRRLIADAARAQDTPTRQRLGHELRMAVRALSRSAESFGEHAVAMTLQALIEGASLLDFHALSLLEEATALLTASGNAPLAPAFEALLAGPGSAAASEIVPIESLAPVAAIVPPRAGVPPAPAAIADDSAWQPTDFIASAPQQVAAETGTAASDAPSGAALSSLLDAGLAGLSQLNDEHLSEPAPVDEDDYGIVPIEDLLYRGKGALRRAVELGDALKRAVVPATPDALAELYDLLALATAE